MQKTVEVRRKFYLGVKYSHCIEVKGKLEQLDGVAQPGFKINYLKVLF